MMYPRYLDFMPMNDVMRDGVPMRSATPYWYNPDDSPGSDLWMTTPRGMFAAFFDTTGNGRIEDLRT